MKANITMLSGSRSKHMEELHMNKVHSSPNFSTWRDAQIDDEEISGSMSGESFHFITTCYCMGNMRWCGACQLFLGGMYQDS